MVIEKRPKGYWTKEKCIEVARRYSSRGELRKDFQIVYVIIIKNGWQDDAFQHMLLLKRQKNHWSQENCRIEAFKYSTRTEFKNKSHSAYNSALRNGWLDELCSHMKKSSIQPKNYWTSDRVKELANNCKTKAEFRVKYTAAFSAAYRNGWLSDLNLKKKLNPIQMIFGLLKNVGTLLLSMTRSRNLVKVQVLYIKLH